MGADAATTQVADGALSRIDYGMHASTKLETLVSCLCRR